MRHCRACAVGCAAAGGGRPESAAPFWAVAKMAAVLQQVLERAELSKLPKPVQGKLERFLADQQSEIDGLRARHERFKVDSGESGEREAGRRGTEVRGSENGAGLGVLRVEGAELPKG